MKLESSWWINAPHFHHLLGPYNRSFICHLSWILNFQTQNLIRGFQHSVLQITFVWLWLDTMCAFLFQAHPPPRVPRVGSSPQAGHYRRGRGETEISQSRDNVTITSTVCQKGRQPQTLAQITSPVNVNMEIQFGNYSISKILAKTKLWNSDKEGKAVYSLSSAVFSA